MWIFARLFRRYRVDILFVFLLLMGFYILYQTNSFQGLILNNGLLNLNAAVNRQTKTVTDYFGLRKENVKLEKRIVALQNQKKGGNPDLSYNLAQVSYIDLYKKENFIIIDKGKRDGVAVSMLIITPENSVVGDVVALTNRNALVRTVMNSSQNLTAMLKDGTLGLAYWGESNKFGYLKIKNIPSYVKVKKGDQVVTSGKGIFPADVIIGQVTDINVDDATKFYILDVKLTTDFLRLKDVEIIKDESWKYKDTLIQIKDSLTNESENL